MPKPTPIEDLIIPPQDNRICGTICICSMTAVLSSVAIVYLTVAIYMPYTRAIASGIDPVPIMCTTTRAVNKDNCDGARVANGVLAKPLVLVFRSMSMLDATDLPYFSRSVVVQLTKPATVSTRITRRNITASAMSVKI